MLNTHRDLVVWQHAMELVRDVYELCSKLPAHERFELGSQLRRCAVSIPSNIAEGYARESRREYLRYLVIARASRAELQTQLLIVYRVGYISRADLKPVFRRQDKLGALLYALIRSLRVQTAISGGSEP